MHKNRIIQYGVLLAILTLLPLVIKSSYIIHLAIVVGIYCILALGLEIILGLTGLFSLGHAAFYGMGAYVSALLALRLGTSFWLALAISILITGLFGVVLGFPALRLKGDYLAIATLGFGEIFRLVLVNWAELTRGPMGLPAIPRPVLFGFPFSTRFPYYYLILLFFILAFAVANRLPRTFLGRAFKAIRDDEDAASFMGVNITKYKIVVFVMGGMFAGLAGSFYAHYVTFISPDTFLYQDSAMTLCGFSGQRRVLTGPVVGATP